MDKNLYPKMDLSMNPRVEKEYKPTNQRVNVPKPNYVAHPYVPPSGGQYIPHNPNLYGHQPPHFQGQVQTRFSQPRQYQPNYQPPVQHHPQQPYGYGQYQYQPPRQQMNPRVSQNPMNPMVNPINPIVNQVVNSQVKVGKKKPVARNVHGNVHVSQQSNYPVYQPPVVNQSNTGVNKSGMVSQKSNYPVYQAPVVNQTNKSGMVSQKSNYPVYQPPVVSQSNLGMNKTVPQKSNYPVFQQPVVPQNNVYGQSNMFGMGKIGESSTQKTSYTQPSVVQQPPSFQPPPQLPIQTQPLTQTPQQPIQQFASTIGYQYPEKDETVEINTNSLVSGANSVESVINNIEVQEKDIVRNLKRLLTQSRFLRQLHIGEVSGRAINRAEKRRLKSEKKLFEDLKGIREKKGKIKAKGNAGISRRRAYFEKEKKIMSKLNGLLREKRLFKSVNKQLKQYKMIQELKKKVESENKFDIEEAQIERDLKYLSNEIKIEKIDDSKEDQEMEREIMQLRQGFDEVNLNEQPQQPSMNQQNSNPYQGYLIPNNMNY